jgi:phage tail sheath protein FI
MLIVDSPADWSSSDSPAILLADPAKALDDLGIEGLSARNAALYFPRLLEADPAHQGRMDRVVPCGAVAGIFARTDAQRGVWKAPAGPEAAILGIAGLEVNPGEEESATLNRFGINCLRSIPGRGLVLWGVRTLRGADHLADEYKYVPVRRLALFIEESVLRGLRWVVFEPNDEPLWARIRAAVDGFLLSLFRQGAFEGAVSHEAYFVKCDAETTTQGDVDRGIVNIVVGFAPLRPAEFVILTLELLAERPGRRFPGTRLRRASDRRALRRKISS